MLAMLLWIWSLWIFYLLQGTNIFQAATVIYVLSEYLTYLLSVSCSDQPVKNVVAIPNDNPQSDN